MTKKEFIIFVSVLALLAIICIAVIDGAEKQFKESPFKALTPTSENRDFKGEKQKPYKINVTQKTNTDKHIDKRSGGK